MCVGGSDKRIGCLYHQFSQNLQDALNFVINAIGDNYVTVEHNNLKKPKVLVKTPTIYSGRPVGIYQTDNYDKDVTIIKIQNFSGVAMSEIITSLNKNLSSVSTITDISASEDNKTCCYKPYDMKILFKKSDPEAEIPNLLEFENIVPSSDVPDSNNLNTYAESEAANKQFIEQKKKMHSEITLELSDQNNPFDKIALQPPNLKKNGARQRLSSNYIDMDLVEKLANNNSIADLEMQHKVYKNKNAQISDIDFLNNKKIIYSNSKKNSYPNKAVQQKNLNQNNLEFMKLFEEKDIAKKATKNCSISEKINKKLFKKINKNSLKIKKLLQSKKRSLKNRKKINLDFRNISEKKYLKNIMTVDGAQNQQNTSNNTNIKLNCWNIDELLTHSKTQGLNISEFQSNPHWISCKITADLIDNTQLNIVLINLHISSAGIRKKKALESLENHINKIKQLKNQPKILIVGNFNMDIAKTSKQIKKIGADIEQAIVLTSSELIN
ncbi:hypothetical protein BB561_003452 [Smittium simulii]|uniref:Endonuclease/exonuclease/phosphatase domain-containing protein n=1 Tax=Smittium simulii TaxID=133385 RepID=A0A2T9YL83_9FUNG|nr:hypothetical protein BB561_003452 [Smittium simulii]